MRLIEGVVEDPLGDERAAYIHEVEKLQAALDRAQQELHEARAESREAKRAIAELRRQLGPLYRALQSIYGETDAVAEPEPSPHAATGQMPNRERGLWESWKQKLGDNTAASRVIDALLEHGELTVAQLRVAAKMANQTVYDSIHKLNKLGLVNKNGGRFSLKKLS